ncbi:MAG: hypothetical protein ACRDGS_14750 [Chloroflexota bacterium]
MSMPQDPNPRPDTLNTPIDEAQHTTLPDFYAEGVQVQAGYQTIRLVWVQYSGLDMGSNPQLEPLAVTRMSPQQALVMAYVLRDTMRNYEKMFGKINLPDDVRHAMHVTGDL